MILGATLANVSEAPIKFKEIVILYSFVSQKDLITRIIKNYLQQGALVYLKLIGSIDIIGNPIGLLDKIGSGFVELFNEPRKGLLKGPEEFAKGMGKGVKGLFSNIVGGSLGSVSKITGSLYTVVKYQ